jgi:hypothetical protein
LDAKLNSASNVDGFKRELLSNEEGFGEKTSIYISDGIGSCFLQTEPILLKRRCMRKPEISKNMVVNRYSI